MFKLRVVNTLLLLFILSLVAFSQAPDTSWTTYFGRGGEDYAYSVIQIANDHFLVGGTSYSGDTSYDACLLELDENGDTVWTSIWGSPTSEIIYSIVEASDGGYVVVGVQGTSTSSRRAYIVKVDALGDTVWSTTFPDSRNAEGRCISNTSDGGYIVTGFQIVSGNYWDVFLLKLDQDGSRVWWETYGGSGTDEGHCVEQTADGGYIVFGRTNSFGAGSTDLYVIKTNSDGTTEWSQTFGGELSDEAHGVAQTSDGGYIVAGEIDNPNHGVYAVKLNDLGDTLWTRTYTNETDIDVGTCLDITVDGGFIFGGYTIVPGQHHDFYFLRANSEGDSLWAKTIGFYDNDRGRCIKQTSDGGYILVGSSVEPPDNGTDIYIVKLNDDQVDITDKQVSCPEFTALLQNHPNPFNASTNISFKLDSRQSVTIKLYDALGREIQTIYNQICEPGSHSFNYDASSLNTGVYFYTIYADDKSQTQKMVIVK